MPIGPNMESQAARLADTRIPAGQRQSLARNIGRLQGNHHLGRLLSRNSAAAANKAPAIQRRALGAVANQALGRISFTRQGMVPAEATITVEEELVLSQDRPGRFTGFNSRLEGYGQAWRHRDRVSAVVQDSDGKYHTLKTDFPGRGVVDSLQVQPLQNNYRHLWWVNLPRATPGRDAAALLTGWTARANQAMTWHTRWGNRQVPPDFRCPHGGQHGANLNDFRNCIEAEFAGLLVEALDIGRGEVHIIPSGGAASATAMVNFNLEETEKARAGIAQLPADRTTAAPRPILTFGPAAFESRSEIQLQGTAVHESTHFSHAQQGLQWLERWRAANTRTRFPVWLRRQLNRGRLNQEQYDLIIEQTRRGDKPDTEIIAHLNGFMASYHHMPIVVAIYRFEQMTKIPPYWAGASDSIKATFMSRLANYYRGLNANYRRDFDAYARRSAQSSRQSYRTFFNRVVNDVLS